MIIFTRLGITIVSLLLYILFLIVISFVCGGFDEDNIFLAAVTIGIVISLILSEFITKPESFGYQKITVSENVVEENI